MIKIVIGHGRNRFFKLVKIKLHKYLPFAANILRTLFIKIKILTRIKAIAAETEEYVQEFFKQNKIFEQIEIETINKCNGTCSFCPANKNTDPRPFAQMSENTLRKIIDNLAELDFRGAISYFSNNEPLLDKRIVDFVKYGVQKVPNASHCILTNGTLLDEKKFQELIDSGLTHLMIDNYNQNLEMNANIKKIYDKYKDKEFAMVCEISLRLNNELLSNRGGSAPNGMKIKKPFAAMCCIPFEQISIRADCGVSLCCNDVLGRYTLGNVEKQTLEEIWFGDKHLSMLKSIRDNLREDIEICRKCDIMVSKSREIFESKTKDEQ